MNDRIDDIFDRLVADDQSTLARWVLRIGPLIAAMLFAFFVIGGLDVVVSISEETRGLIWISVIMCFMGVFAYFYWKRVLAALERRPGPSADRS